VILNRRERDFYALSITTDAAPEEPTSAWEASFDNGATWVAGDTSVAGITRWLVHGPLFDPDSAAAAPSTAITTSMTPLLRLIDNPTVDFERGPAIILVT
jgi:hypothetical protein